MPSVFWNIGGLGEFREKITEVWRIASATLDLPFQPQGITDPWAVPNDTAADRGRSVSQGVDQGRTFPAASLQPMLALITETSNCCRPMQLA